MAQTSQAGSASTAKVAPAASSKSAQASASSGTALKAKSKAPQVIFGVVVFIIVLLGLQMYLKPKSTVEQPVITNNITAESTNEYNFYYPKTFEKVPTTQSLVVSQYAMPAKDVKNFRDNLNLVKVSSADGITLNEAYCTQLGDSLPKIHAGNFGIPESDIKLSVKKYLEMPNTKGCLSTFTIKKDKLTLEMSQKLFHKEGDSNFYIVTVAYEDGSKNKQAIEEAMNAFSVK